MSKFGKFQGSFELLRHLSDFLAILGPQLKFGLHEHATANHNGLKSHILCACLRVNSMCSKLEGNFKHIGLTAMTQSMDCHGI